MNMSGTSGRAVLPQPPTKTIVVYRNGDAFFPGRKFVINQRQMSTFDSFLSSVTRGVEAPFGAVRNVYTPREGHKIHDLVNLQHGERYVAGGGERFKKLDYYHITTKKPQKKKNEQIRPVVHSRIVVSARWRKIINESCTINVFTNGDVLVPPARILIPKYTLTNWERVLAMVTQRVNLRTGAVYRLCTLDGTTLLGPVELENNQYYVAVGAEKFRFSPYFQWVPGRGIIRDNSHHAVNNDSLPVPVPTRKGKHAKFAHTGSGDDLEHTARGHPKNSTESYFYAKPEKEREKAKKQKQVSRLPLLYTTGGSVFRAKDKRSETVGAAEIQEDGRVTVDLPIDQVEAQVVEEEEQYVQRFSRPAGETQSPYKTFLQGSDASRKVSGLDCHVDSVSAPSSGRGESGRGTGLTSSRDGGLKSPLEPEPQETKEEVEAVEASNLCGIRSRMSKFFKEKRKK
ncbi:doublecortin domain-containing protein 2C isoform X2 [Coregonus clupeaformis]|uniref:doublecortin domain-containing protein 2C isoform X2 n=1 Tax=Coregonus clupeaformis TaxID=59861 RepID=UPI001BE04418|nr:doublecortin domain-containing protein 2C isoform X2 [Coregonus clupeaformis]